MLAFRAMGTDVTVSAARDERATAERVAVRFADAERRFSRFREDSELAQLNRARGPMVVSPEMFETLERAREWVLATGGVFDPGVGETLRALGYDRSFSPGALDRDEPARALERGSLLDVRLHAATRTVDRPEHVQIDLGGIVKGVTVDAASVHLGGDGAIDAGGDAIMAGRGETGEPWLVDVEDPLDPARVIATVAVEDGAVATSAGNRRAWRLGGALVHHLVDPRTRAPARSDILQATVFAPRAEWADVLAKTAFVLGSRDGRALVEAHGATGAIFVLRSGELVLAGRLDVREVADA